MQGAKETAANIGASAKAGMEKTKATVQEKAERMTTRDPLQKELATQKKDERMTQAELDKQAARQHNAAAKQAGNYGSGAATGEYGQPTGAHQMSALPGHGTGQPAGHVSEGVVGSHPVGPTTTHNPRAGVNPNNQNYGSGI